MFDYQSNHRWLKQLPHGIDDTIFHNYNSKHVWTVTRSVRIICRQISWSAAPYVEVCGGLRGHTWSHGLPDSQTLTWQLDRSQQGSSKPTILMHVRTHTTLTHQKHMNSVLHTGHKDIQHEHTHNAHFCKWVFTVRRPVLQKSSNMPFLHTRMFWNTHSGSPCLILLTYQNTHKHIW